MSDSLVIAGAIELLGGGVASQNPLCEGAVFRLQPGADPGAPQPTTDYVASLILDGERPFGHRASDRTITLPIWITGPTRAVVAAAREVLQAAIDQDTWTLTWTRDPAANPAGVALPLVLDCFRASPTKNVFNTLLEKQGLGVQLTVTITALPYGRSDQQIQVPFTATLPTSPATPPPPSPVLIDAYTAISSRQCTQSPEAIIGSWSACWDPDSPLVGDPGGSRTPFVYSSSFASSPLNLTGMASIQMYLGLGSRYWAFLEYRGRESVSIYITLTDINGQTLAFSRSHVRLPVSPVYSAPCFSRVSIPIPQTSPVFDYAAVTGYTMTIVNRQNPVPRMAWCVLYINDLTAQPGSVTASPVTHGAVYTLYGVQGTARTPCCLQIVQGPTPQAPAVLTTAGAGTYTVPANTAYVMAENVGAGGAGANAVPTWGTVTLSGGGAGFVKVTTSQAAYMLAGQMFRFTAGPNSSATIYVITAVGAPSGGQVAVSFTPASPVTPSAADTITCLAGTGSGGGSGEYAAEPVFAAAAGQVIPYSIGAGGIAGGANGQPTVFGPGPSSAMTVQAGGGQTAWANGPAGAGGALSVNAVHYPGAAGRTATGGLNGGLAGGGASSAGASSAGATPVGSASVLFTTSGTTMWTSPITGLIYAETWGDGGGGASGSAFTNGAGGGGGAYASGWVPVTVGVQYPAVVGPGGAGGASSGAKSGHAGTGSSFTGDDSSQISAGGGHGGAPGYWGDNGGDGGQPSGTQLAYTGGDGGNAYPYTGGGGSSASPAGPGNAGGDPWGAPAPAGGGAGGTGPGASTGAGGAGQAPGGGGAGSFDSGYAGGAGGAGQVRLTYQPAVGAPTTAGASSVGAESGAGGAGATSAGNPGSAGSQPGGAGGGGNDTGTAGFWWAFEDGTADGWAATAATVAPSQAWAASGSWSLLVTAAGTGTWSASSPTILAASPGQAVSGSAVVYNPSPSVILGAVAVNIDWFNSSFGYLSTSSGTGQAINPGAEVRLQITGATAPASTAWARVTVIDAETPAAGVQMAIDDASLCLGSTAVQAGGGGAAGQITVTPYAPSPFKSLILHRPPAGTAKNWQPCVSVGGGGDPPDGTHFYTMPQPAAGVNAGFSGTYTVYLVAAGWDGGSGSTTTRQIQVTVTQYEYSGGPSYAVSTAQITVSPSQVTNGIVTAGVLTLPVKKVPPDNTLAYYQVSVTDSDTADRFYDAIFLDTQGQTVVINEPTQAYAQYWVDAPGATADLGDHLGSNQGRPAAISVMDNAIITGPLYLEPSDADNLLFAYSADGGAPQIACSYYSAWWFDRYA